MKTTEIDMPDPSDPYLRESQTFPKLTAEQIERAKRFGTVQALAKGAILFDRGERTVDFFVVLDGNIEIFEYRSDGLNVFTVHGPSQFTGEIDLFNDREILVGGRMGAPGTVLRVDRASFRKMLSAEPDIGEIVMRAFILRRVGLITYEQGSVTLIGSRQSADRLRIERFLRRNGYPVRALDRTGDEAQPMLEAAGLSAADLPVVICADGRILRNPSTVEVAQCLGLVEQIDADRVHDVVVVGAGPSGLAAAVYAASEGLDVVVLEAEAPGGQAGTSSKIENYLGFPTGISGQALAGRAQIQAQKFGAKIALPRRVVGIDCDDRPYALRLDDGSRINTETVVIASGARYRTLDLDNGRAFDGAGVHYAATRMEAGLCANEDAIVVGGGNSAGQAAVFLSRHARHVHVLVRGARLADSMSDYLVGRIDASSRITLRTRTEIVGLVGEHHLDAVTWRDRNTGETETHAIRHVFLMIGAAPNSTWLNGCLAVDDNGFVCVGEQARDPATWTLDRPPHILETSRPGVFAVGDVRAGSVKRVASAVGEGSIAVQFIHRVLEERREPPT